MTSRDAALRVTRIGAPYRSSLLRSSISLASLRDQSYAFNSILDVAATRAGSPWPLIVGFKSYIVPGQPKLALLACCSLYPTKFGAKFSSRELIF